MRFHATQSKFMKLAAPVWLFIAFSHARAASFCERPAVPFWKTLHKKSTKFPSQMSSQIIS